MNPHGTERRSVPPKRLKVLPNSSFYGSSGQFSEATRQIEVGSTMPGKVWYGTLQPGADVGGHAWPIFILESMGAVASPKEVDDSETNLDSEYRRMLVEIEDLVRKGRIGRARQIFWSLPEEKQQSRFLNELARMLEMPRGRTLASATGRRSNASWLRTKSGQFHNEWVAIKNNELVDHDASYKILKTRVKQNQDSLQGIQFIHIG